MRRTALLLVLVMGLAGCSGGSGSGDDGDATPTTPRPDVEISAPLPDWQIGQGWTYVVDVPGQRTQTFTMMVADQRDGLWVVGSDDRTQALHHAVYSTNPVLGRIGTETLSPFQDGEPVSMYRFPLTDGKQWSAAFFGESMAFRSDFVGDILLQPSLGLGTFAEGFRVSASGPSGTTVLYDYVEPARWFTSFEVRDTNGSRVIRLDLVDIAEAYTSPYHFFRGEDLLVATRVSEAGAPVVEEMTVPLAERFTDGMAIGVSYVGRQSTVPATANITVTGPPDGQVYFQREITGLGQKFALADLRADPACVDPDDSSCAGDFNVAVRLAGDTSVQVLVISYQTFAEGSL